jgi:hypothetical protein
MLQQSACELKARHAERKAMAMPRTAPDERRQYYGRFLAIRKIPYEIVGRGVSNPTKL